MSGPSGLPPVACPVLQQGVAKEQHVACLGVTAVQQAKAAQANSQGEPPWAVSLHPLEQQQAMAWGPSAVAGHVRTMQACGLPLLV